MSVATRGQWRAGKRPQRCASCKRPILACRWVKVRMLDVGQDIKKKKSHGLSLGMMERASKRVHPGTIPNHRDPPAHRWTQP